MITLRQLRFFEAVARLRGYTRAANELGVTQPAVSAGTPLERCHFQGQAAFPASQDIFLLHHVRRRQTNRRCHPTPNRTVNQSTAFPGGVTLKDRAA